MLRFSANLSLLFNETDFSNRFQAASEQGFSAVEIQFPYSLPAEQIQAELTANRLQLILFNVAADDLMQGGEGLACVPEKRNRFRTAVAQTIAYAEILKPALINVLPGRCLNENRRMEYLHTFMENLAFAVEAFSSLGIKTVFEAVNTYDMPGFLVHRGQQMLKILNQINHSMLAMQYDIYHMIMMGEKPAEFINQHSVNIGHIQFADSPGRGQPGTGNIDFKQLFNTIDNSDYSGWLGAEYHPVGRTKDSFDWFNISKD
jgi:hydroxypyruvate isomerase